MNVIILAAKSALAVMFLVAGGAKLADLSGFAATVRLFIPRPIRMRTRPGMALGVALAEILVGAVSLAAPTLSWVNLVVLAVGGVFIVVSVIGYVFYRGRSCRCFGALSQRKFDVPGILRSALVTIIAVVATLHVSSADIHLNAAEEILLLVTAALLTAASFTAARALATSRDARPGLAGR